MIDDIFLLALKTVSLDFEIYRARNPKAPYIYRSLAEKSFAKILDKNGIDFLYEPFSFGRRMTLKGTNLFFGYYQPYKPDFFIEKSEICIEIKCTDEPLPDNLMRKYTCFGDWLKKEQTRYIVLNLPYKKRVSSIMLSNFGHPDDIDSMEEFDKWLDFADKTLYYR